MFKKIDKNSVRLARHARVREKVYGTSERPRLCVYRSLSNISVQVIDDTKGHTLVSASTLDKDLQAKLKGKTKTEQSQIVGAEIAKKAKAKKIKQVVFDRGGYLYTGRVKALADACRDAGLNI